MIYPYRKSARRPIYL